jgi:hypothetical protein
MTENKKRNSNYGGARPGAGRPRGSGNKIRIEDLLESVEGVTNMSYAERLALNYAGAIGREDWNRVENYDRAFLNKIVADRQEIEVTDSTDAMETKQAAFAAALAAISQIRQTK